MVKRKDTKMIQNYIFMIKIVLFVFIAISPVLNFKVLSFLNNTFIKILLLTCIIILCFIDFQLGLIATIAFLIIIINLNNNILMSTQRRIDSFIDGEKSSLDKQFEKPVNFPVDIDTTQNIVCGDNKKNDMNSDLMNIYVDEKIKPYDVFIHMMTNDAALQKAQGSIY